MCYNWLAAGKQNLRKDWKMKRHRFAILFVLVLLLGSISSLNVAGARKVPELQFTDHEESYEFIWNNPEDPYLTELRTKYELEKLVAGAKSDLDRVKMITRWVSGLWKHDGSNTPKQNDPLYILDQVQKGERFRCVEYAIVINGCLNALGIPSRTLSLKTADVETRESGAGHVVVEAWLRDARRWAFADGQWNAVPTYNNEPISAVEFQRYIAKDSSRLRIEGFNGIKRIIYFNWIAEYLYYFDIPLDSRVVGQSMPQKLMLVPLGAPRPTVFQRNWPITNMAYTNSVRAFYPTPAMISEN